MKSHIQQAHAVWRDHLRPTDIVIDATCGNGHDTLVLASLAHHVYALDIQKEALETTKKRLSGYTNITYCHQCHSTLPDVSPALIVYNLGYLPGGDKEVTTMTATTLRSLEQARTILAPGGMISITLYPGHREGEYETEAILKQLPSLQSWQHRLIENKDRPTAPKLLLLTQNLCYE